jgi:hypothetical protein
MKTIINGRRCETLENYTDDELYQKILRAMSVRLFGVSEKAHRLQIDKLIAEQISRKKRNKHELRTNNG